MYDARPNAICYVCEEGVVKRFVSTLTYLSSNDSKIAIALPVQMTVEYSAHNHQLINEPSHEIMVLFILRKLILQMRMRSQAVGLDV